MINSPEPHSRSFNRDSSSKRIAGRCIRQRLSWRLCLSLARIWQHKKIVFSCFDFNIKVTHEPYTVFELMTEFKLT